MFRSVFIRLAAVAGLMGLASFGLLGAAPSTFASDPTTGLTNLTVARYLGT